MITTECFTNSLTQASTSLLSGRMAKQIKAVLEYYVDNAQGLGRRIVIKECKVEVSFWSIAAFDATLALLAYDSDISTLTDPDGFAGTNINEFFDDMVDNEFQVQIMDGPVLAGNRQSAWQNAFLKFDMTKIARDIVRARNEIGNQDDTKRCDLIAIVSHLAASQIVSYHGHVVIDFDYKADNKTKQIKF